MEEQKNNQEQLEEIQTAPAEEVAEEIPAAEPAAEEPTVEPAAEETPAEPVKKATPGKIAVAVGTVILLAAILIALIVSGGKQKRTDRKSVV